jgi:hypothetical protein
MPGRRALAFAVAATAFLPAGHAATYHVSSRALQGDGTPDKPFSAIRQAAEVMQAGDTCVIHAGIYRETVRPGAPGVAAQPIRFIAAEGEEVLVTGTDPVTNWSLHANGIYRAEVGVAPVEQLFVDRKIMHRARHPNTGSNPWKVATLVFEAGPNRELLNPALSQPDGYWTNATLWGLSERLGWVASQCRIAASAPGKIIASAAKSPWYGGGSGRGYLFGLMTELDAPCEWHREKGVIYLRPPEDRDPNERLVEAANRRWAFDLSGLQHVEVRGVGIFAAGINMDRAAECVVDGVRVRWPCFQADIQGGFNRDKAVNIRSDGLGIVLAGRNNVVRNSVIAYSTGDGVSMFGASNTVENCVIHDCDTSASDCAPVTCTGVGHAIRRNTMFNGGRSILVHRYVAQGRIENNHLYNAGLLSNDLGMTYTYHTDGQGTVVAYNLVHHNLGRAPGNVGIYLDDMSRNHVVHHNVVWGVSEAMAMNPPDSKGNLVLNNTLDGYNVSIGMSWSRPQNMEGTRLINNIFLNRLPGCPMPNVEIRTNLLHTMEAGLVDRSKGDYRLRPDSPGLDAGEEVPPYTDGFAGKAPDMGAFEHGREPWSAGSSLPESEWMLDPDWTAEPGHKGPCYERQKN